MPDWYSLWKAIVLGFVQGATEYIPVSSTAHLKIVPSLCGWGDPGAAFTAVIQWGTLLAAVIYFRQDILDILAGWFGLKTFRPFVAPESRLGWMIIFATLPVVVVGLAFHKRIEEDFRNLYVIAGSLISLAILLAIAEAWHSRKPDDSYTSDLDKITWTQALLIGVAQALAVVPGVSRSGVTITAALFVGLARPTAARFSFLLSLPAIFGAGLYELIKEREKLLQTQESAVNLVVATVVAGVVGYASIAWLLEMLKRNTTLVFIVYRIALGLLILGLLYAGTLEPR
jgi:undecaprenyl-diphosphatase